MPAPAADDGRSQDNKNGAVASFAVSIAAAPSKSSALAPPGTRGIGITSRLPGAPARTAFFPTTVRQRYCQAGSGAVALTCTLNVSLAPGQQTFVVDAYDRETTQSAVLATGRIKQTIAAHLVNAVAAPFYGVVAFLQISLANGAPATGHAASIPLSVAAADATGYAIVGRFDAPIVLTDSDKTGATSPSAAGIASAPAAAGLVVAYNGAALKKAAAIVAKTTSALLPAVTASAILTPGAAAIVPQPSLVSVDPNASQGAPLLVGGPKTIAPYAISTGTDVNGDPACANLLTISRLSNDAFTVTPNGNAVGTCWLSTRDAAGHTGNVPVMLVHGAGGTVIVSPTPSPTPQPTGEPVTAQPASITICPSSGSKSCSDSAARTTITQYGSNGAFSTSTTCPGNVATIALASTSGSTATYTITGQNSTGKCTVTFTGNGGNGVQVSIDVTGGGIGINTQEASR